MEIVKRAVAATPPSRNAELAYGDIVTGDVGDVAQAIATLRPDLARRADRQSVAGAEPATVNQAERAELLLRGSSSSSVLRCSSLKTPKPFRVLFTEMPVPLERWTLAAREGS
jgi:hypothetical protein